MKPYSSQSISTNSQAKINSRDESDTDYDTDALVQESNPKKYFVKLVEKFTRSIDKNIQLTPKFLKIVLKESEHLLNFINDEKHAQVLVKIISPMADDNSETTSIQIKHEPMDL